MLAVTLSAFGAFLASPGSATAETGKVRVMGTYSNAARHYRADWAAERGFQSKVP